MNAFKIIIKKEYIINLVTILTNINIITEYFDLIPKINLFKQLFLLDLSIIIFNYFYCIFLESEFDSTFLKLIQIKLEKLLIIISLIVIVCVLINFFLGSIFYVNYFNYKKYCPFSFSGLDYGLHLKRRCELYNIDNESNYPFQYICSDDESKLKIFNKEFFEKYSIGNYSDMICSKVETLINNNKVIDEFVKEYYKEELYYCNLEKQIKKFSMSINPKKCQTMGSSSDIFILYHIFLSLLFMIEVSRYFKFIKANIVAMPSYTHLKQE